MAIRTRQVKNKRDSNGVLTGRPGTVYDVDIKYTAPDGAKKTYTKRGFATKRDASQHEAEMRTKLQNPGQIASIASQRKQTVANYLNEWVESYARVNLRPSTYAAAGSLIKIFVLQAYVHDFPDRLVFALMTQCFRGADGYTMQAVPAFFGISEKPFVPHGNGLLGTCADTGKASGAFALIIEELDRAGLGFRVGAPFASKETAFEKKGCAYSGTVIGAEFLNIEQDVFVHGGSFPYTIIFSGSRTGSRRISRL